MVPANVPAPPPTRAGKTPPNPWGKLGSPGHRAKVREVAAELKRRGWTIVAGGGSLPERMVSGTAGTPRRFPDITARKGGRILHVQVGKKTKGGLPVARERDRLSDIRKLQEPGEHTVYIEWP